jgi:hypothetical protein
LATFPDLQGNSVSSRSAFVKCNFLFLLCIKAGARLAFYKAQKQYRNVICCIIWEKNISKIGGLLKFFAVIEMQGMISW